MGERILPMMSMAFVMSITPGPNNMLLAISGAHVGFRRTVPAVVGVLLGFCVVIGLCAVGTDALITGVPRVRMLLTVVASAYMLWLAQKLWRARAPTSDDHGADQAVLLAWWRFAALQLVNPKTWLACVALISGYLEAQHLDLSQQAAATASFLAVIASSMTIWVAFGSSIRSRFTATHWSRFHRTLAVLAAATAVTFWA
jgi:threonine/homoserine/homoserine lactone efflux protein